MTAPAAASMRPLLPRRPGMPISPANVSTQGSAAPMMMAAPAATEVSPATVCQLRSRRCRPECASCAVRLVMTYCPSAGSGTAGGAGPGHGSRRGRDPVVRLAEDGEVQEQVGGDVPGHLRAVSPLQVFQFAVAPGPYELVPGAEALDPHDVDVPPLALMHVVGGDDVAVRGQRHVRGARAEHGGQVDRAGVV